MSNATINATLSYSPPSASAVTSAFSVLSSYTAIEVGTLDIPDTTVAATSFPLDFGTIGTNGKLLVIKNRNNQDMGVRLNGAVADNFSLAPSGLMMISNPADPTTGAVLTSCAVTTTDVQAGVGLLDYWVFGI